jgi:RNA polymerase sigma factor (sigma-70 family)
MRVLEVVGAEVRSRIRPRLPAALRSSVDEDDVMQVTYIEAVLRFERFSSGGIEAFLAWVARLAENNLVDAIRAMDAAKRPNPARRVRPAVSADSMANLVELLGLTYLTPSRQAAVAEANSALEQAIGRLPAAYSQVVRLYDLAGRSAQEVGAELGKSTGAVFMLRARAHERLRELLGSASQFFSASG